MYIYKISNGDDSVIISTDAECSLVSTEISSRIDNTINSLEKQGYKVKVLLRGKFINEHIKFKKMHSLCVVNN